MTSASRTLLKVEGAGHSIARQLICCNLRRLGRDRYNPACLQQHLSATRICHTTFMRTRQTALPLSEPTSANLSSESPGPTQSKSNRASILFVAWTRDGRGRVTNGLQQSGCLRQRPKSDVCFDAVAVQQRTGSKPPVADVAELPDWGTSGRQC